jgi:hypothetical protein
VTDAATLLPKLKVGTLSAIQDTDWAFYEEEQLIDFTFGTMSIREPNGILPNRPDLAAFLSRVDGLRARALGPNSTRGPHQHAPGVGWRGDLSEPGRALAGDSHG